jgi:hypothetical protein
MPCPLCEMGYATSNDYQSRQVATTKSGDRSPHSKFVPLAQQQLFFGRI